MAQSPAPKTPPPAPARPGTEKPAPNPPPTAVKPEPPAKPEPGAPDERRDPTQTGGKLAEALNRKAGPNATAPRIPEVSLKARVVARPESAAAVIVVDGKTYTVSKDTIIASGGSILKVVEIGVNEVRIEVSPLNETIVLR
ncbi:MAG: hypothetical protein JNM56_19905 [Planctomycetia bacterium]|nr:hypothetical protein [Planctomycetia bacterium]